MDKIDIFDTTLRDGEQSPGATLNTPEKLEIAHHLAKMGVDIIEAGFPVTSPGDFEAVQLIAREVKGSSIAALTHARPEAVDRTWEALRDAESPRIHIVLSTSDVHMKYQLRLTREQTLEQARAMVARAKTYVDNIEYSPMDASRSDPEFLYKVLEATIDAGATTINIPDTVGYMFPEEFARFLKGIFENVSNVHKAVVSVHCHNDLGMATANSLAAIAAGARQVECAVNGLGERAGNASLEEIVMAIKTRKDLLNVYTGIDTTQIYKASRMVSDYSGIIVQPNKAIVGANAFRHESGLHQDGIIKERTTYEIMEAASIGLVSSALVLGKHSGRHAFRKHLEEMGYQLSEEDLGRAFIAFKDLADKKKDLTDRDLEAIVAEEMRTTSETYRLEHVQVSCGDSNIPTATVKLVDPDGQILSDAATGTGPVDAVYKAINRLITVPNKLTEFSVKSVTEGIDAIGEVTIRIESDNKTYTGRGADTDIIVASAKAYMNALNRLMSTKELTVAKQ